MKKPLFLLIAAWSCAIEKDPEPVLSNSELLAGTSSKTYKMTSKTENGVNLLLPPNYYPCNLDDLYKFYTDHSYVHLEGPTKCNTDDTISAGTWAFNALQDSLVIITGNGLDDETVKVKNMSTSNFQKDNSSGGVERTTTYTVQ